MIIKIKEFTIEIYEIQVKRFKENNSTCRGFLCPDCPFDIKGSQTCKMITHRKKYEPSPSREEDKTFDLIKLTIEKFYKKQYIQEEFEL